MNLQQTHQILKNSQSRFLALFEQSPLSMILFSPSGYIRVANQAFEDLFDIAAEDLIASNFNIIDHEKILKSEIFEHLAMGFSEGFIELPQTIFFSHGRVSIVDNDDSWLRCFIYPLKDDLGDVIEVVMMHKDISEQIYGKNSLLKFNSELESLVEKRTTRLKALNEELIRSKIREEAAMRAKDEFFSNMSHELRTPLTAIKEASSMLYQGFYEGQPDKQHELFSIVRNECERLIRSVDSILDASKLQTGIKAYYFRPSCIISLLKKSIINLNPIARKKNIQLELKYGPEIPLVNIDEEKISRVMTNLIGNALKFTPYNGKIVIRIHQNPEQITHIKISVSDTGKGINSMDLDKIFNKFEQAEQENKEAKGSGLGLFIAQSIIVDHKGKIWALSAPGKGSTFYFTLPVSS